MVLGRIAYAASRIQGLIEDLINLPEYENRRKTSSVDLNYCIEEAIEQLHDLKAKSVVINIDPLPIIDGLEISYNCYLQTLLIML